MPTDLRLPAQVSPPEFAFSDVAPTRVAGVSLVALPVLSGDDGPVLGPGAAELVDDLGIDLLDVLAHARATGRVGEVTALPTPPAPERPGGATPDVAPLLLLVGVGTAGPSDLRRAGATLARRARDQDSVATSVAAVAGPDGLAAFVEGMVLGSFGFHWRSEGPRTRPVARVVLCGAVAGSEDRAALERSLAVAGATWLARTLATVPSNLKSPSWLADQAVLTAERAGVEVTVWDEHELAEQGFGGLLAVGRASATPPRFVRLDYTPQPSSRASRASRRKVPRVVLVGKGITFDTGGLSIKPGEAMTTMKRDMTGAAVVLATMGALADVGCPVQVTGLLPIAENAVGGDAVRPGDVVRHRGGRTTEVTNTDAEGRLVMADALAYAVEELAPAALVDVATLTGAIKVALGLRLGGLFATDDALADALVAAGGDAGEPLWRMPLSEEYQEKLSSRVADADNAPGGPGAITAALFLQHFTGGLPWAHLDIASVGDSPTDSYEWTAGPTGFGARLLLRWLGSAEPLAGVGTEGGTQSP